MRPQWTSPMTTRSGSIAYFHRRAEWCEVSQPASLHPADHASADGLLPRLLWTFKLAGQKCGSSRLFFVSGSNCGAW